MIRFDALPDPDRETHDRFAAASNEELETLGPAVLSACVALMIGVLGEEKTADLLRDWADAIQTQRPGHAWVLS